MPAVKELPWLQKSNIPPNTKVVKDPNTSLISADSTEASSDTGELKRNWEKGNMTINTPNTQAAIGWIGGEKFTLDDIEVVVSTRNATIAVQSMDGKPINKSRNIVISLGARSLPQTEGELPFLSEPIEGRLLIKAPGGLKLFKHLAQQQKKEIPTSYENGHYSIALNRSLDTYWMFLTK